MKPRIVTILFLVFCARWSVAQTVDFQRDIRPILQSRCWSCHGPLKQEAKLRLDSVAAIRNGGESSDVIVTKSPDTSRLYLRIMSTNSGDRMPPEGPPLTEKQSQLIRSWIESGASIPDDDPSAIDPKFHWAFRKPQNQHIPLHPVKPPKHPGVNPIDSFLEALRVRTQTQNAGEERAESVIPMGPLADRPTLLRRVYLDLVGIPPTVQELEAFCEDDSPDAYEMVVDRLLASPMFGERWGRHWMDVWRYSDWYGRRSVPDVMNSYPMIWRWRDWIVNSVNQDKPYDQMILDMLAADELQPLNDETLVATGYLVRSWFKWNYETWKKDLVEHTGKAFLGLTLNCCQCHDHKYDPFTQEDYFRFRAFFEPLELRHDRVTGEPDPGPFEKYVYAKAYGPIKSGMIRVFDEYLTAETFIFAKGDSRLRMEGKPPVVAAPPQVFANTFGKVQTVKLPIAASYPAMKYQIRQEELKKRKDAIVDATRELENVTQSLHGTLTENRTPYDLAKMSTAELRLSSAQADLNCFESKCSADDARFKSGDLTQDLKSDATVRPLILEAIRAEQRCNRISAEYQLASAKSAWLKAEIHVAESKTQDKKAMDDAQKALQSNKSKYETAKKKLEELDAKLESLSNIDDYTPLSPKYLPTSTGRRTALARWIVDKENPLTARVAANHVWLRHFGKAIVDTTHDFGLNGAMPSNPQLLDWLACELMESGWSLKHLHRMIVTSTTYRLASILPVSESTKNSDWQSAESSDPDNRFYWRFHESRMQAEVVRDSLLSVCGALELTLGGHEIDHRKGLTSYRRSIYFAHHGEEKMEFLELFDAANACDCYKRTTSVQPQQALALSNSELTLKLSRSLAKSLWDGILNSTGQNRDFVRVAFLQILNRYPRDAEFEASLAFLEKQQSLLDSINDKRDWDAAQRARENLTHALLNHNDFVTVR